MKMNKALFWDFDGTLVYNASPIWRYSIYTVLTNLDYEIDIEELRTHMRKGYSWSIPEIPYTGQTGEVWWDKLFEHLLLFCDIHMISKEHAKKAFTYLKEQVKDSNNYKLYEDAVPTLRECLEMGYKNYILSNNFPDLPLVIKDLGIADYFTDYIVSANVGYEKPRIEIFQYALKLAGYPNECYMIGDNPTADIEGGKTAGMKTILVHGIELSDIIKELK
ncbi:MAG: HAD-IA family hydrolase [Oscillospiraceae bacterium]|nr:HAD-IA family hydrolase [Oscillospiraceae bacterium]